MLLTFSITPHPCADSRRFCALAAAYIGKRYVLLTEHALIQIRPYHKSISASHPYRANTKARAIHPVGSLSRGVSTSLNTRNLRIIHSWYSSHESRF